MKSKKSIKKTKKVFKSYTITPKRFKVLPLKSDHSVNVVLDREIKKCIVGEYDKDHAAALVGYLNDNPTQVWRFKHKE